MTHFEVKLLLIFFFSSLHLLESIFFLFLCPPSTSFFNFIVIYTLTYIPFSPFANDLDTMMMALMKCSNDTMNLQFNMLRKVFFFFFCFLSLCFVTFYFFLYFYSFLFLLLLQFLFFSVKKFLMLLQQQRFCCSLGWKEEKSFLLFFLVFSC